MLHRLKNILTSIPPHIWILLVIIIVGIFLRIHHFSDWLFFQGDQARDLLVARKAINGGPGWLPLLGPKAGGTFLRLGPIFYYFQYISASIFGLSPASMAFPDLFFSILTIPLFFIFAREFFSKSWSLMLTAGYAVCFFAVQYSRFAWNPNSLPFFNLLFFYSLLQFFKADGTKKKWLWAIPVGIAYAIASQLHFVSLLSLPTALILIFVLRKLILGEFGVKSILKLAVVMLAILAIFYTPMILSEHSTGWNNSLNLLSSIGKKSSDGSTQSLIKQNIYNFSKYFLVIWSGLIAIPTKLAWIFGALFFSSTATAIIILKKRLKQKDTLYLILLFSWLFSYFMIYVPTANDLQPRHFLVILPLPFIFWGIIIVTFKKFFPSKYTTIATTILLLIPILANVYSVKTWFSEISDSQVKITMPRRSGLLKSVQGESWWHLEKSAEFMHNDCEKNKLSIFPPKQTYRSLIDYAMHYINENREYSVEWNSARYKPDTCYYAVHFTKNDYQHVFDFADNISKIRSISFGDMSVIRFSINKDETNEKGEVRNPFHKEKDINPNKNTKDKNNDNEIAKGDDAGEGMDDIISDGLAKDQDNKFLNISLDGATRINRVYWKDLWLEN